MISNALAGQNTRKFLKLFCIVLRIYLLLGISEGHYLPGRFSDGPREARKSHEPAECRQNRNGVAVLRRADPRRPLRQDGASLLAGGSTGEVGRADLVDESQEDIVGC